MATVILLDTHVAIWLYAGELRYIPARVRRRLDREQLGLSPVAQLELGYLHEIGRIRPSALQVTEELSSRLELQIIEVSGAALCRVALDLTWTRDPFDRLLAAHAIITKQQLVTRDESLRQHLPLAWWAD